MLRVYSGLQINGMWRPALSTLLFGRHFIIVRCVRRNLPSTRQEIDKNYEFTSTVYKLPHIRIVSLINRTKAFQTAAAATSATLSFALFEAGVITNSIFYLIVYLGFALNVPLYMLGFLCTNMVGGIYLSEDQKTVKIAHVNFWGRRKELVIKVEDIVPLSEISGNPSSLYFTIERYSQPCKLKLSLKHGTIDKMELFTKIFGSTEK